MIPVLYSAAAASTLRGQGIGKKAGFHKVASVWQERSRSCMELQVEQIGEARVLWKKREFTTLLSVDEDERDPSELRTAFSLIRSVGVHPASHYEAIVMCRASSMGLIRLSCVRCEVPLQCCAVGRVQAGVV